MIKYALENKTILKNLWAIHLDGDKSVGPSDGGGMWLRGIHLSDQS